MAKHFARDWIVDRLRRYTGRRQIHPLGDLESGGFFIFSVARLGLELMKQWWVMWEEIGISVGVV